MPIYSRTAYLNHNHSETPTHYARLAYFLTANKDDLIMDIIEEHAKEQLNTHHQIQPHKNQTSR